MLNQDFSVVCAVEADYDELIDHLGFCFEGTNFPFYVRKIYYKRPENSKYHYIVRAKGRIVGSILFYPISLDVLGQELNVLGVGSVAVHPDYRNRGIMSLIFDAANTEISKYDMAVLHGQRQRYENYGFYPAGIISEATIFAKNLSDTTRLTLKEVRAEDSQLIDLMINSHKSLPVKAQRKANDFFDTMFTYGTAPYAFFEDGVYVGFCGFNKKKKLFYELCALDAQSAVRTVLEHTGLDSVCVRLPLHSLKNLNDCCSVSECVSIKHCCNIRINNFYKVLKAFLGLKSQYMILDDGEIILNINSQRLRITIKNNEYAISEYSGEREGHELSRADATAFLFSNLGTIRPFYKNWFPLPLSFPDLDNV